MAAIVSASDYIAWRTGSTAVITFAQFPFYEAKAERELDRHTFGRLSTVVITAGVATITIDEVVTTLVLADLKAAICEIAEFLFQLEQTLAAGMTSFSNDGQCGSYDVSRYQGQGRSKEVRMIAKTYLAGTVLLQAGVTDVWHG